MKVKKMRSKSVMTDNIFHAINDCPWVLWLVHLPGRCVCFESFRDYKKFMCVNNNSRHLAFIYNPVMIMQLLMCGTFCADCVSEPICYKSKS